MVRNIDTAAEPYPVVLAHIGEKASTTPVDPLDYPNRKELAGASVDQREQAHLLAVMRPGGDDVAASDRVGRIHA